MRIYRAKDYYDMSRKAANIISAQVIMKPDCVLGLATGSTPVGTYAQLVEWYKKGDLDFSEVKTVNLDEYLIPLQYTLYQTHHRLRSFLQYDPSSTSLVLEVAGLLYQIIRHDQKLINLHRYSCF